MIDKIIIGTVAKAQGIKGEVKIAALTDDPERFKKLKQAYVGNLILKIDGVKVLPNGVFMKFAGVDDRNAAELLKNLKIEIDRKDAVKLENGRYFIVDLIGSTVVCDGVELGTVANIVNHGSADIYEIVGGKNFMFPLVEGLIVDVNTDDKRIVLDSARLQEVAVYED